MAQLWLIERDISGWTDDELDAAGLRAKLCAPWYPGLEWVRSFRDRAGERTFCYYRAEREDDIWTHARAASLPCDTVLPVEEILPSDLDDPDPSMVGELPS